MNSQPKQSRARCRWGRIRCRGLRWGLCGAVFGDGFYGSARAQQTHVDLSDRPSVLHKPFRLYGAKVLPNGRASATNSTLFRSSPFDEVVTTPNQLRWDPLAIPEEPTDFVDGITTITENDDSFSQVGMAVHIYACNKGMGDRYFYNADGEMLIVPEMGRAGNF